MDIIGVIGIGIIGGLIAVLLKDHRPEFSVIISLITGIIILGGVILSLSGVFENVKNLFTKFNLNNEYVGIVMKALGISYLAGLGSDICIDAGQTAIAAKVELAGKVAILLISLPLFNTILETALNLIPT